ncbi:MAG: ABC transporter permease [Leptolinea sp.]|jgi:simple sugar transport system permease protein|nr:ABC transporter permease [Leptolinea sp.]
MDDEGKKSEEKSRQSSFDYSNLVNEYVVPLLAVVTAIVMGALVIWSVGGDPISAYIGLVQGAFGSVRALSETTVWATPYIFAGLAVAVGFKGGLFNIGAEGQLAFGAVAAAWAGYALPSLLNISIPPFLHIILTVGAGVLAGGIWAAIPGYLKAKTGAHEVINTIMMNYVALNITSYLLNGPMKDPNPLNVVARTPKIAESAQIMPIFSGFRFHWGFILALLIAFATWWVLWKTKLGFEIRTTGLNPDAAKYAGINVAQTIVITMGISGGLAGLAGAIEVAALNHRHELGFSTGYGFDAIAIALLGKNHPLGVVLASLLFAAMRNGATRMQFLTQIPVDIISIIQALILLFVAADAIVRYIFRIRAKQERVVFTRGWGK